MLTRPPDDITVIACVPTWVRVRAIRAGVELEGSEYRVGVIQLGLGLSRVGVIGLGFRVKVIGLGL